MKWHAYLWMYVSIFFILFCFSSFLRNEWHRHILRTIVYATTMLKLSNWLEDKFFHNQFCYYCQLDTCTMTLPDVFSFTAPFLRRHLLQSLFALGYSLLSSLPPKRTQPPLFWLLHRLCNQITIEQREKKKKNLVWRKILEIVFYI